MYIESVRLQDVKCFEDIELHLRHAGQGQDRQSNWNVILGGNGDGKSTLLRAVAACLVDASTAERLLFKPANWAINWVRDGQKNARLRVSLSVGTDDRSPGMRGDSAHTRTVEYVVVDGNQELELNGRTQFFASATLLDAAPGYTKLFGRQASALAEDIDFLKRYAFSRKANQGWLSCGYGSFRRMSGGASKVTELADPLVRRFNTLFDEGEALVDCESWLKELDRKASKAAGDKSSEQRTLREVKGILCDLLPGVDGIDIEDEVRFRWRRRKVGLDHLSDGYRSMFALSVDLLRWLELTRPRGTKKPLNQMSGVVLIDEIDAHLHPEWQREAGFLLTRAFPNLQFIVTSHSPFVVMAAGEGAMTLLQKQGSVVRASQEVPYVRGWAVDQVLSQVFGLSSLRDPDTAGKLGEYEKLRLARGAGSLKGADAKRLVELEAYLNEHLQDAADVPGS